MLNEKMVAVGYKDDSKPQCESCKHFDTGVIYNYPWATCNKNWSDKHKGETRLFWGVLANWCNNHKGK